MKCQYFVFIFIDVVTEIDFMLVNV